MMKKESVVFEMNDEVG